jgi:hypothetical protein
MTITTKLVRAAEPHQVYDKGRQLAPHNRPRFPASLSVSLPSYLLDLLRLAYLF